MAEDAPDATTGDGGSSAEDEAAFLRFGAELAALVAEALPGWVERSVAAVLDEQGIEPTGAIRAEAAAAGVAARDDVAPRLRALLATDLDEQATGPLALLREAVRYPTDVLVAAGAAPVARDEFDQRAFPGDLFALAPAAFGDLDERLAEPGIRWGAAKAYLHLARRRGAAG